MSAASVDHTFDETAVEGHDRDVDEVNAWLERRASLRRPFTRYEPRTGRTAPAV
jgi:hypothetical protein